MHEVSLRAQQDVFDDGSRGLDLGDPVIQFGREQLEPYASVEVIDAAVESVARRADGSFDVRLEDGGTHAARRLILATGVTDTLPDIPGLAELWGTDAIHCPYCHGFDEATVNLLESRGIVIRTEPVEAFDCEGGTLQSIRFAVGTDVRADAVFVPTTLSLRGEIAAQLGCATFEDGSIEVSEFGATSVAGVYAVGDIAKRATQPMPVAAVGNAANSGTIAAVAADQDLLSEDHGLPNPFAA